MSNPIKYNKGAAMIIVVLFFIILSTTLLIGVSVPISNQIKGTSDFLISKSSYNIADSQAENAFYRFNKGKNDAPTSISLLGSVATAVMTNVNGERSLVVEGTKSVFDRYVKAVFKTDTGFAFNYGLQVGDGGLRMEGSSKIIGSVYANGDIVGNGGPGWYTTSISGSAIAATLSNPEMVLSVSSSTASTFQFPIGRTNANQDIAQSFIAATSTPINHISFYVKKNGNPVNATVKIVNNNGGNPGSTVITSGELNASNVTTSFSHVPVSMTTSVSLTSGSVYWIVVDVPYNNNSNYFTLLTYNNVYSAGSTKQGRFVSNMTNLATTTSDFDFNISVGGNVGLISNVGVGTSGTGEAWANSVTNTTVTGNLFCKSGSGNNKACNTTKSDPMPIPYPISQDSIDEWKESATLGGSTSTITISGVQTRTLGPIKINGNLSVGNSGKLIISGPIYVTGNVLVDGDAQVSAHPDLAAGSGLIIGDNNITFTASGVIVGSGVPGSYITLISNRTCTTVANCMANPAITVSGASGAVVLSAAYGSIKLLGSAYIKAAVAKMMHMEGTASINYESGLAEMSFSSGPSGAWTVKSWKEVLGW